MRRCRSRPTAGAERDLAAGDVRPCRPHRLERHQVPGARLLDRARWKQICGSWQRRAPGALNLTSWHVVLPASDEPTETDGEALGSEVVGETDGETVGAEVVGEGRVHLGDLGALQQMCLAGNPDASADPHTVVI